MKKAILHLGLLVGALFSVNAASAQSVVTTTGGTANYVPKFTGSATVGKSQIVDTGTAVGIGTTAPSTSLNVSGGSAGGILMRVDNTTNATNSHAGVQMKTAASSNVWQWFARGGDLFAGIANVTDYMVIKAGGNVGIGTNSPLEKLEVTGNVKASKSGGALYLVFNGTAQNGWFGAQSWFGGNLGGIGIYSDKSGHQLALLNNGALYYDSSVGIGTTAPSEKLQVNGNVKANGFLIGAAARQTSQILPLDNASGRIDCLEGISYRAKGSKAGDDLQLGMVGEDVEACFPELVATDAQGEKAIDYARLVVPLVETAKEQQQIIRELEARLARIEARLK